MTLARIPRWSTATIAVACASILSLVLSQVTRSEEPKLESELKFSDEQLEFFEKQVRPLLVENCFECHSGADKDHTKGGLRLDSRTGVLAGGDTGAAVTPGKPQESLLINAINYGEPYQMPPKSKLADKDIETITRWVAMGLPWPDAPSATPPNAKQESWSVAEVGSSRVDLQACKLEYSIVSPK